MPPDLEVGCTGYILALHYYCIRVTLDIACGFRAWQMALRQIETISFVQITQLPTPEPH